MADRVIEGTRGARGTRTLARWNRIQLHAYPTMLALGTTIGIIVATRLAPRLGLDPARTNAALLLLLIPALVGSRLLYVAVHWRTFRAAPKRLWQRDAGGLALYGGFMLTLALSWPLLVALGLPGLEFWDAAAIVILIGMAFTKVGCHLNGCCVGRAYDGWLSIRSCDVHGRWKQRYPSQLLESLLALALLILSFWLRFRLSMPGSLVLVAAVGYGVGRFWLEGTREEPDVVGRVDVNRTISVIVALTAATILCWRLAVR